ncbi:NUDIX domain-containing protein [Streptosporangium sp. NPDC006007]|uniref:NUDIX domain-containing protein n=1 Tax=Streptosporangium sp. NPDC006007 TaxID=3154575 RepID=UPI0033A12BFE
MTVEYTHPDVLTIGVRAGWADPVTDPSRIDWAARQATAVIPFEVIDGRPMNPFAPTGIERGRNELGHWGEALCADAIVMATVAGRRRLVMVARRDGHGWALPGGHVDLGEDPGHAAVRELEEETGLVIPGAAWRTLPARYVPDPRASDEAWMVTVPAITDLGFLPDLPPVTGADDAKQAAWIAADSYSALLADLAGGEVFAAHRAILADLLMSPLCPDCGGEGRALIAQVIGCGLRRRTVEQFAACLTCSGTGRSSTWLPPGTASTWICRCGAVNPRTVTTCGKCGQ